MKMEKSDTLASIIETFIDKKTDSIKVEKGMTGKYSFEVKLYSEDLSDSVEQEQVLRNLKGIYAMLEQAFPAVVKD